MVISDAGSFLSFWPEVCEDEFLAPEIAKDILACWAHLRRFPSDKIAGEENASKLDQLVRSEAKQLVVQFLRLPFSIEQWAETANQLSKALDGNHSNEQWSELERSTRGHFFDLDEWLLAAYAAALLDVGQETHELVQNKTGSWAAASWDLIFEDQYLFYSAAGEAADAMKEYRTDIHRTDLALWHALTCSYQLLAIVWDLENCEPEPEYLSEEDRIALRAAVEEAL